MTESHKLIDIYAVTAPGRGPRKSRIDQARIDAAVRDWEDTGMKYVDVDAVGLDEPQMKSLNDFMNGQTMPHIPGVYAVYLDDFERWNWRRGVVD